MPDSERYDEVIREFCFMNGIDESAGVGYGTVLQVGKFFVRIDYVEEIDRCRVMVDLGEPDWEHEVEFYKFLLQADFDNANEYFPVLSLEPDSNHVILSEYISLETLEEEISLAKFLNEFLLPWLDQWESLFKEYFGAITASELADINVSTLA